MAKDQPQKAKDETRHVKRLSSAEPITEMAATVAGTAAGSSTAGRTSRLPVERELHELRRENEWLRSALERADEAAAAWRSAFMAERRNRRGADEG